MNRIRLLIAAILLLSQTQLSVSTEVTLSPGWQFTIISDASEGIAMGGIDRLTTPNGTEIFSSAGDEALFDWTVGVQRPSHVEVASVNDQIIATLSGFRTIQGASLPLKARMTYTANEAELFCEVVLTATATCRIEQGLGVMIPVDDMAQVDFFNTMGKLDNNIIPIELTEPFRLPFQNRIITRSGLGAVQLNLRNPILPTPARTASGVELELVTWYRPNTTNPNGLKNLCSILAPGDSIHIEWGVSSADIGDPLKSIAVFSPHPRGGDCSAYLAFDDIPSLEPEWAVPTDASNVATPVTSRWLQILDEFPDVRFTWLLLTDSIQRLGNWRFIGWWPPTNNVYPDSMTTFAGRISCRLALGSGAESSSVITQTFAVQPGDEYSFELMAKSVYPADIPTLGISVNSWKPIYNIARYSLDVDSSQWTRHTIRFVSDSLGVISISIRASGFSGEVFIDEASLTNLRTGENSLAEYGGFETYQPFVKYDTADSLWSNARGMGDLATEPTQEYLDWLKIVQDGSPEWRYSRQVGLGLHGLHHTPDTLFATDATHTHEFNFYNPVEDSIRMKRIADDLTTAGLDTNKIMAFFRFPGHRHTESVLKPILDHGVRVFDQGNFVDRFYGGILMRNHRRTWITSSVSWHDVPHDNHMRHLESSLNAGMFSLMGCHYHIMNSADTPGERERARGFFSWIENSYPDLVWMKGAELADLWDEFGGLRNIRQSGYANRVTLTWDGASTAEESIYLYFPTADLPVLCTVDGVSVPAHRIGSRVFVSLPSLPAGSHRLDAAVSPDPPVAQDPEIWRIKHEEVEGYTIGRFSAASTRIAVKIYDASGRQVAESRHYQFEPGKQEFRLTTPPGPSGIYFARIEEEHQASTVRLTRLR